MFPVMERVSRGLAAAVFSCARRIAHCNVIYANGVARLVAMPLSFMTAEWAGRDLCGVAGIPITGGCNDGRVHRRNHFPGVMPLALMVLRHFSTSLRR